MPNDNKNLVLTKQKMILNKNEIDWLVLTAENSDDIVLKEEAKQQLKELGISESEITERLKKLDTHDKEIAAFDKTWEIQAKSNAVEKYSTRQMIKIFFIDSMFFWYQISDFMQLHELNYKFKFKQKLILVISGLFFWISLVYLGFKYDEYKRIQEINKADIHNWEENRIK
jgi:hypothetical protein